MKLIITDIENADFSVEGPHKVIKPGRSIHPCIGCFGCWIKTPGKCVIHDGYEGTGMDMSQCTELILVSRCVYGSVSPFVKMVQDRAIPYLHPDFVIRRGEMHHKRRYQNMLHLSACFYGEDTTDAEKETARKIIQANADNFDGTVERVLFCKSPEELAGIAL